MRTLVLNAGYEPLAVVSFRRALVLVMNEKATVIEHVEGEPVRAASAAFDRPAAACCAGTGSAAPTAAVTRPRSIT